MLNDKVKIYVWPDATWCREDKFAQYAWKSDDCAVHYVPIELSDDEIDHLVSTYLVF